MPVTSLLVALFALMMVVLSLQISLRRRSLNVAYGDGDDQVLKRRIRAHGNFVEYVPLALIVLAFVEIGEAAPGMVWALAAAFLACRILHAAGMLVGSTPLRAAGMLIQHAAFFIAALWLIHRFFE